MTLSKNIRYLRRKNDMSQDTLAEKLGYKSFTTIQKWEMGTSEPPLKTLQKMAEIFGVDINDLASEDIEAKNDDDTYYINPETRQIAQEIATNSELRGFFDAARDASPEDLQTAYQMLLALKRKERGYED